MGKPRRRVPRERTEGGDDGNGATCEESTEGDTTPHAQQKDCGGNTKKTLIHLARSSYLLVRTGYFVIAPVCKEGKTSSDGNIPEAIYIRSLLDCIPVHRASAPSCHHKCDHNKCPKLRTRDDDQLEYAYQVQYLHLWFEPYRAIRGCLSSTASCCPAHLVCLRHGVGLISRCCGSSFYSVRVALLYLKLTRTFDYFDTVPNCEMGVSQVRPGSAASFSSCRV